MHPNCCCTTIESPRDLDELVAAPARKPRGAKFATCCAISFRFAPRTSRRTWASSNFALLCITDVRLRPQDRLIWDTGHQIYPHISSSLGAYDAVRYAIRTKGGLMGYPNPRGKSDFDLFMTGHAGASVSTVLGIGDVATIWLNDEADRSLERGRDRRWCVSLGHRLRGDEQRRRLAKQKTLVVLNDNKMSICPRVGGVARLPRSPADGIAISTPVEA